MKRFCTLVATILALTVLSCSYDDTAVWNKVNNLENRVAKLEKLCEQANSDIEALQSIIEALQKNDYVTSISPIVEDGKTIGYTITFAQSGDVNIYNGKDGEDGNGGYIPNIGVKKDTDGIYYWTLDGKWLLDSNGNKVSTQGTDGVDGENGEDGEDGKDGKDGVTPKLKIENDYWYVSYDNGVSWSILGKATVDGENATTSESIFERVDVESDCVIFYLKDGSSFTLPIGSQTDEDIIRFLDNAVKIRCIMNWDTDGDNELSKAEAAAVTTLGGVFEECDAIVAFDEFQYFTGLTVIEPHAFDGATNLCRITLPKSIKTIGNDAFYYCLQLKQINLNDGLTKICRDAFSNCKHLKSLTIPASVEIIEYTLQSDGEVGNPFRSCVSLEAIYGPYATPDNRSLIMDGTLICVASAGLEEYTIPEEVRNVANHALYHSDYMRFPKVVIHENVEYIDYCGLLAMEYYFESMTPPSMHKYALGCWDSYEDVAPVIHIPDGASDAYIASDWSSEYKACIYFDSMPVVPADPDPSNLAFNHRGMFVSHTGCNEPYSPEAMTVFHELAKTEASKHYNLVQVHGGSYAYDDPARSEAAVVVDQFYDPRGYPDVYLNFYDGEALQRKVQYYKNLLMNNIKENGADVGIAMAVVGNSSHVICSAEIKANVAQEYRVSAWLLESDIYSPNQAGATEPYHHVYDFALRNIAGNYSPTNISGESIGFLSSAETKTLSYAIPVLSDSWNVSNMGVLVIVSAKDDEGRWEVANTAYCHMDNTKEYEYVGSVEP